jgi:hypothetical protein
MKEMRGAIMKRTMIVVAAMILIFPVFALAGVDDELTKNLNKTECVHSWQYNKSAFKLYLSSSLCKENETTATLLTIRYIFEANKSKFPKKIEIYTDYGKQLASYPFKNIPSLVK